MAMLKLEVRCPHSTQRTFDEMPDKNTVSRNCVIDGYSKSDMQENSFFSLSDEKFVAWICVVFLFFKCPEMVLVEKVLFLDGDIWVLSEEEKGEGRNHALIVENIKLQRFEGILKPV